MTVAALAVVDAVIAFYNPDKCLLKRTWPSGWEAIQRGIAAHNQRRGVAR